MRKIVFATHNPNKVREVQQLIHGKLEIIGLDQIGCHEDIPETNPTINENAFQKAQFIKMHFGIDCFAEDTGLLVDALNGEPGVYSARYAGEDKNPEANMSLLLKKLRNEEKRKARFKTVIALIIDGKEHQFVGEVFGEILKAPKGTNGFGYDPVFLPAGFSKTFGEMTQREKSRISHRSIAVNKLLSFLEDY